MKDSKVYLYEEPHSGAKVVGKFFAERQPACRRLGTRMRQSSSNLQVILRGYGMAGYPHHVVRPLGTNASLE